MNEAQIRQIFRKFALHANYAVQLPLTPISDRNHHKNHHVEVVTITHCLILCTLHITCAHCSVHYTLLQRASSSSCTYHARCTKLQCACHSIKSKLQAEIVPYSCMLHPKAHLAYSSSADEYRKCSESLFKLHTLFRNFS